MRSRLFSDGECPQVRRSRAYRMLRNILSEYQIAETCLDASLCGVPQVRKRFFAFGSRWGQAVTDRWVSHVVRPQTAHRLTVKEYLGDEINVEFYYRHPRNYSRRSVFSVHEPSPTIRAVNRPVPPNYTGNRLDSAPPSLVRALTSYERSRIQTFPASWDWAAPHRNGNVERQIGNAVPVNLAAHVGRSVVHAVQ